MNKVEKVFQVAEVQIKYIPKRVLGPKISTPIESTNVLRKFFDSNSIHLQEEFIILYLNRANRLIGVYKTSKGTINGTLVDVRLVMSVGLKLACSYIILSHNHPSGNLNPSHQDLLITNKIKAACKILDIELLDHIIVSPNFQFHSFAENGDLGRQPI